MKLIDWKRNDKMIMAAILAVHMSVLLSVYRQPAASQQQTTNVMQVSFIESSDDKLPQKDLQDFPRPRLDQQEKASFILPADEIKAISSVPVPNPIPPPPIDPVEVLTVLQKTPPSYPIKAIRDGVEGTVEVLITIDESGDPLDAKVLRSSGDLDLDEAAVAAALHYHFSPKVLGGAAVIATGKTSITFSLSSI